MNWKIGKIEEKKEGQFNENEFKEDDGSEEAMLIGGDIKILCEAQCPKC